MRMPGRSGVGRRPPGRHPRPEAALPSKASIFQDAVKGRWPQRKTAFAERREASLRDPCQAGRLLRAGGLSGKRLLQAVPGCLGQPGRGPCRTRSGGYSTDDLDTLGDELRIYIRLGRQPVILLVAADEPPFFSKQIGLLGYHSPTLLMSDPARRPRGCSLLSPLPRGLPGCGLLCRGLFHRRLLFGGRLRRRLFHGGLLRRGLFYRRLLRRGLFYRRCPGFLLPIARFSHFPVPW